VNPASSNYPNNIDSWALYGPFDLSDAVEGDVRLSRWYQIADGDRVSLGSSINGLDFVLQSILGPASSTSSEPPTADGWQDTTFSLSSRLGQPRVWFALRFLSDGVNTDNGTFIDDLVIEKRVAATSTATPTPTPPATSASPTATVNSPAGNATLIGSVAFQGRGSAGDPRWAAQLSVRLFQPGTNTLVVSATPTSSSTGELSVTGVPAGIFDVEVKQAQSLSRRDNGLTFASLGTTTQNFGVLLSGDVNNDNVISILDFSVLSASFGRSVGQAGYDARADLAVNNVVDIQDFSLLSANFGLAGPVP
jgi:hypothetical protein